MGWPGIVHPVNVNGLTRFNAVSDQSQSDSLEDQTNQPVDLHVHALVESRNATQQVVRE